jgi:hypothetical protein
MLILICALFAPSVVNAYTILWDTSHGVAFDGFNTFEPSGHYSDLTAALAGDFTMNVTPTGFTAENLVGADVAVVNVGSAYYSIYTQGEVDILENFVNGGGGLVIMGSNPWSQNANVQPVADVFGITLASSGDDSLLLEFSSGLVEHDVFEGLGETDNIYFKSGGELFVSVSISPVAWSNGNIMVAAGEYGAGRVVTVGDLYVWANGTLGIMENRQFGLNTFEYLAIPEPASIVLLSMGGLLLCRKR